ncbi:hypothetical protein PLANPX_0528 [Lacipirellula parvula]|uniref:Uncharacterized protein n=1 Tax=Lacipirellula parvula TaxID=2650471 RepID=A0A5K7X9B9_9BACT|nr:hypothetical protein PLANPX_0528 [Lacipirellula parvula]
MEEINRKPRDRGQLSGRRFAGCIVNDYSNQQLSRNSREENLDKNLCVFSVVFLACRAAFAGVDSCDIAVNGMRLGACVAMRAALSLHAAQRAACLILRFLNVVGALTTPRVVSPIRASRTPCWSALAAACRRFAATCHPVRFFSVASLDARRSVSAGIRLMLGSVDASAYPTGCVDSSRRTEWRQYLRWMPTPGRSTGLEGV